ncbi:BFD-like [2Fe-2S] binding protein [Breznakibacter xylanolyticus]|uniref:BFD-like [2Fe-2S] binding protein n=1 Tax=Breznakibacter xylanolyticus TaxID=990 RepID=A0A2W7PXY7_9BACT|nr:(2Fe-2S)-binding protein [Breznakibacter xylanolyticus]MBN2744703.1 (2Fe-2S)-binding protein [Marinilabiliaceae bacterium]PZX14419.1 BFD-like [2Fe-2S] binding protein [Breznakibacter xylanolyticus]
MPFNDFVCKHLQLTREDIVRVIREKNLTTFEQIQDETDAGTVCGACVAQINQILNEERQCR